MNKEFVIHSVIWIVGTVVIYYLWKKNALTTTPGGSVLFSPTGENLGIPAPGSELDWEAQQLQNWELSPQGDLMQS